MGKVIWDEKRYDKLQGRLKQLEWLRRSNQMKLDDIGHSYGGFTGNRENVTKLRNYLMGVNRQRKAVVKQIEELEAVRQTQTDILSF